MGTGVCYGRFVHPPNTTPAFVEGPPTSCAPISNSNCEVRVVLVYCSNWEDNLNISDLNIIFGLSEMDLGSEGTLSPPRKPSLGSPRSRADDS